MFLLKKELPNEPWENWVNRVFIHVPSYFSFDGKFLFSGGLQRTVRDISKLIKNKWNKQCIIVQKGKERWKKYDFQGIPVIAIKTRLSVYGDPMFGYAVTRLIRKGDAIIYMGGETAWPFFLKGAKSYHVGIWWDGPLPIIKKIIASIRLISLFHSCRSVVCVDTNVINWLRTRSYRHHQVANKAIYIPNYVDLEFLPIKRRLRPKKPLRILFARRYEYKRGYHLAIRATELLLRRGKKVKLIMCISKGSGNIAEIKSNIETSEIRDYIEIYEKDLNSIFSIYQDVDVALVPTLWSEGTSFSCVEAIAAGIPVVTTTVGGLPNLVIPGYNGFVVPPNEEAIAKAIELLMAPDFWREIHENCISMRNSFSKEIWENRVLEWLKS